MKSASRGRPANPEKQVEQKMKLITAAADLLSKQSYRSITIRQLGEQAGVNSAMIRYYFDNKQGLFIALLDEMSTHHFAEMKTVFQSDNPIKSFIHTMLTMLNHNPGLALMLHDEVLQQDSEIKSAFIERFPKRMAKVLPQLIQQQISAGRLRSNLNPKYAAFSLMGSIVFPFLATPIREEAWEIKSLELAQPEWVEHIYNLFMMGTSSEKTCD